MLQSITVHAIIALAQPQQHCLLLILLISVTPAWWWQMVQPNNASHFNALPYRINQQPSCISSGGVPFLDWLYLHKNARLIQKTFWEMDRFNFIALSQTDFQSEPHYPSKYNNELCLWFKAVHIHILIEIQCRKITLHNITCYWSEKQPVPCGILLVHINSRRNRNTKKSVREQCAIQW